MKTKINLIKDFKIALKDIESYVKNPDFLLRGRKFKDFCLLPREIWANWLLCAVLRHIHGEDLTFAEDPVGDGFIINKKTGDMIRTEHVSALENVFNVLPKGTERIIGAINLKISEGAEYAKGKLLVVFFDGAGEFFRNKIRENIKNRHNFESVYCIGLLTSDKTAYKYMVTEFCEEYGDTSLTFKVEINFDFTDWKISQIMD